MKTRTYNEMREKDEDKEGRRVKENKCKRETQRIKVLIAML